MLIALMTCTRHNIVTENGPENSGGDLSLLCSIIEVFRLSAILTL